MYWAACRRTRPGGGVRPCHVLYHDTYRLDDATTSAAGDSSSITAQQQNAKAYNQHFNPLFADGSDKVPVVRFGCNVQYDGVPMKQQPWQGDVRYEFGVSDILKPNVNLYFNSLTRGYRNSWVTLLAVSDDNAAANEFARAHHMPLLKRTRPAAAELATLLPQLLRGPISAEFPHQLPNPFLAFDEENSQWKVTTDIFVDVLYAGDVALDICQQQSGRLYANPGMPSDRTKYV